MKIGLAGLGCVAGGFYKILEKDKNLISKRCAHEIEIVAVSSRTKKDFLNPKIRFYENILDLARDPEIEVIVEAIGGKTIAKELIILAIKNGKKVITANKALLAEDGLEIAQILEENNGFLAYEAAIGAAIPIVKNFKESFAANEIKEFYGILNGTSNFILDKMQLEKRAYADVLKEAQELGYAEADPTFDVGGIDAAHKLVLLAAIASNSKPNFKETYIEGIENITVADIEIADELGYKIKLLTVYRQVGDAFQQSVYPCLLKKDEKIAQVNSSFNAILTLTSNANYSFVVGRGAGGLETGSAIASDVIDIARNNCQNHLFNAKLSDLISIKLLNIKDRIGQYFISLKLNKEFVKEENLAMKIFGESLKLKQAHMINGENDISCAFITENIKEADLLKILQNINKNIASEIKFLRVESTNF
jgi:homoserine dehydrogenase